MVLLAGYFCEQCRLRMGLARVILAEAARNRLQQWSWPGNVRELEHAIHRAVVLARATQAGDEVVLEPQHFQFAVAAPMLPTETAAAAPATGNINLREATDSFQREAISRALEANQGNWAATARALELDVANLHRLAKRLGLTRIPAW
ncbi:anaerobic nitric oxide reductase transcription regulator NorR [Klebsiella pneumoniae]|nr:anaerobic nitric oxide reductase transcription regulator NorR [Klebsiella pneumoniae]